jgi:hypothetical protein
MLRLSCLKISARASKKCCGKANVGGKGIAVLGQKQQKRAILKVIHALCFLIFIFGLRQAMQAQTAEKDVPGNPLKTTAPTQPIPYSHKTHLALGLTCQGCHTNPDPGNLMTFPPTGLCMGCHTTIAKDKESIRKLAQFAQRNEPVPWVRVYAVLPGVQWTHRAHLQAGAKCGTCHGDVSQMASAVEATSVTTMAVCISCHQKHKAKTDCVTCHAWPK